jgi:hypothetical protein
MSEVKKVRMKVDRGNPAGGIIRAGAVVSLHSYWADKFIADGSAESVEENTTGNPAPAKGKNNGGKNGKSKN